MNKIKKMRQIVKKKKYFKHTDALTDTLMDGWTDESMTNNLAHKGQIQNTFYIKISVKKILSKNVHC